MHVSRIFVCAAIAATLCACSAGIPKATQPQAAAPPAPLAAPRVPLPDPAIQRNVRAAQRLRKGVYVAEYYTNTVLAYAWATLQQNRPPVCSLNGTFVVNVATDTAGNVILPDGGSRTVSVDRGPNLCGPRLGSFADAAGQPSDAATTDAAHGTIYVGNLQAKNQSYGNVSACTLAAGCTRVLQNGAIGGQLFGVAEDASGNVYASGYAQASGSGAALVVWNGGTGSGLPVRSYRNASPGGLTFDSRGRLLAIDTFAGGTGALWLYSGCPAHCRPHGPFALHGQSVFGKLDASERYFVAADFEYGQVDVYRYRGEKGLTYLYSFGNGLTPSGDVEGVAMNPANT